MLSKPLYNFYLLLSLQSVSYTHLSYCLSEMSSDKKRDSTQKSTLRKEFDQGRLMIFYGRSALIPNNQI